MSLRAWVCVISQRYETNGRPDYCHPGRRDGDEQHVLCGWAEISWPPEQR